MEVSPGRRLRSSQEGASSVEYAILVSLIAVVILVAVALLGMNTSKLFQKSCDSVALTQSTTC